jgi:hypothetical protein
MQPTDCICGHPYSDHDTPYKVCKLWPGCACAGYCRDEDKR